MPEERYQILVPEGRFVSIEVVSGRNAEEGPDWATEHDPVVTFECWFLASNLTRERPQRGDNDPEFELREALRALNAGEHDSARARLSDALATIERFDTLVVRAVVCTEAPEGWPA